MSSSIHSQKILKDAKVFVFFEDEIFQSIYIGRDVRKKLRLELMKILSTREFYIPGGEKGSITLNIQQMIDLLEFLKLESVRERRGFIDNPINKTLQYIKICLEIALTKGKNLISGDSNLTFEIANKMYFEQQKSKYVNPISSSNYDKNDYYQIAVWCLDSDGLQLDERLLNLGNSTSVPPLQWFLSAGKGNGLKKNKQRLQHDLSFHHQQSNKREIDFTSYKTIAESETEYKGTDSIIIMLSPFAEIFRYSINPESLVEVEDYLGMLDLRIKNENKPVHGVKAFIGRSYLSSEKKIPNLVIKPEKFQEVRSLFAGNTSLSIHWKENNISEFLNLVKPDKLSMKIGLGGEYIAAGLYLKKAKILSNEQIENTFPMSISQNLPDLNVMDKITIYKFSASMTPMWDDPTRKDRQLKGMNRISAWSSHRRCNGKTLIPLHPDHVSKEILERYGTDVYGGFKPCQRYVKKNLRCPHHM